LELQRCQKNDVTISFVLKESSNEDALDSYPIRMLSRKYKALKLAPYGVQMIVQNAASKRIDLLQRIRMDENSGSTSAIFSQDVK
jgi:hypothetical protein